MAGGAGALTMVATLPVQLQHRQSRQAMKDRPLIDLLAHPLRWRRPRTPLVGSALGALLVMGSPAQAQTAQQALRATWTLQVAPIAVKADSNVRATTSLQPDGTELDFESSLGVSQRHNVTEVTLGLRPWERHRFTLGHFRVERAGTAIIDGEVRFADQVFSVGSALSSRFETEVSSFDYAYSVWQSRSAEVTLGLGVHGIGLQALLSSPSESRSASESARFVTPTLRLGGGAALGPRWSVHGHWHGLQHQRDGYRGRLRSYQVALQAQLTPQVAAALGVRYFKLRMDVDRPDWVGFARTVYRGPFAAVVATF